MFISLKPNEIYFFLVFAVFFVGCATPAAEIKQACFGADCFNVILAQTQNEREQGLMNIESMSENEGMLFLFAREAKHAIWMKNMYFPIDIIWLDQDYQVVYIEKNAPVCQSDPCPRYLPEENAFFVLEINAGVTDKLNIIKGDKMTVNYIQK